MSKTKIAAGDSLTVGDLTDDHLGAVIEVEMSEEVTTRLRLGRVTPRGMSTDVGTQKTIWACGEYPVRGWLSLPVTIITPPPVVQPDEPTARGQCIRIENKPGWRAIVVSPGDALPIYYRAMNGAWFACTWTEVLEDAGDRQIIVSDPPRWPDESPMTRGERVE